MTTTSFVNAVTLTDAAWFNDADTLIYGGLTSIAGTNTITAAGPASMTAYAARQRFVFIPAVTNTGAVTINITPSGGSALGAKSIFYNGAALASSELRAGTAAVIVYNGTQFDLLNSSTAAPNTVPAGCMMDFAGTSAPAGGWLLCDGTAVSRTTYATLFAAIGTTWGVGDGSTTFNLPPPGRVWIGSGAAVTTETVTSQAASSNAIPVASNNTKWITGMPVVLSSVSGYSGLSNGSYFIVRASSTTVKFATTLANAQNGTVVTVTGTGSAILTTTFTTRTAGEVGGEEAHAMNSTELLAHQHNTSTGGAGPTTSSAFGILNIQANSVTENPVTSSTGGNAAMNIMPIFAIATRIIKT